ncbi:AarF/ABC1/UbiB kinase family protein [Pseudonocardia eucalypti]|uniref:AarF/ABC1/UbiB kinase family protein n=1 Tax=Pseudonocardia eucalypti TaxID=648755 RepID=A0ABP9PK86_9PSEU|nr:putative unusual protein kinase regulating ubiquinone biosynthesis (AarF/ABC1/UbiB family) [Pseudonocardia eucalypti]
MTEPPRRAAARTAKLSSIPVGFAGRTAAGWARRIAGADRAEVAADLAMRNADQLFAVLGELKGGAMKLGQALSVYEAAIPVELAEPYQEALTKLQANAPAMPKKDVHRQLAEQLGSRWPERFAEFDADDARAASIGQVHKAIWHDGREVAVKVQYPGADQALLSDLRQLRRFSRMIQLMVPGADVRALLDELTDRMAEELDYRLEADHQRAFGKAFAGDEKVCVPRVVASAPKVLVTEWIEGTSLSVYAHNPVRDAQEQQLRDWLGYTVQELMFSSPTRVGLLHADPHHGNYRILPDGRLGVLDFGACAPYPDGIPRPLGRIIRFAADERGEEMLELLIREGFVGREDKVTAEDVLHYIGALGGPVRTEKFRYHRDFMQNEGGRLLNLGGRDFRTGRSMSLPPQYLMAIRVVGGWMAICSQIDCTVASREIVERWLPGFAD